MSPPNLSILLYHRITKDGEKKPHSVEVSSFRNQMRWLRQSGFDVITLGQAQRVVFGGEPLQRRSVVITFDDGFADFPDHALPILTEFNYPSVVYVVAGLVGKTAEWLVEGDRYGDEEIMSASMLRTLQHTNVEVGSHTLSHPFLPKLSTELQVEEISESKWRLEDVTGTEVKSFAYPYGVYNPETRKLVEEAGYQTATTVNRGSAYQSQNPFEITRKAISSGDSIVGFFHKLLMDNTFKRRPVQGLVNGHHWVD